MEGLYGLDYLLFEAKEAIDTPTQREMKVSIVEHLMMYEHAEHASAKIQGVNAGTVFGDAYGFEQRARPPRGAGKTHPRVFTPGRSA
ncbi:hypothetical protein [Pelagibius sp. Alg239-R121]|uniref:hypothetical protein n=1 Tax=Pelagibius sp. Alg239-R121 TaxID=2993448 RepID=UPI0024A7648F|nr:hypothetical protein [Pelagibius sp. Alg239-R121]